MKRKTVILLIFSAFLLLAACTSGGATTPAPTADGSQGGLGPGDPGYPVPSTYEPPYPIDSNEREVFEQNLTPNAPPPAFSEDTGALAVTLLYPEDGRPVRGQLFFAATMLPVQGVEDGFIPALDTGADPSGTTDSHGVLVISEIPPGKYALTLMTPLGPILVESQTTQDTILFDVTANELTDLGEIVVLLNADTLEP